MTSYCPLTKWKDNGKSKTLGNAKEQWENTVNTANKMYFKNKSSYKKEKKKYCAETRKWHYNLSYKKK